MVAPTESELDARLRRAARRAVDDAQSSVDVEADLARVRLRVATVAPVPRLASGSTSRRLWAAVAAFVLAVAGAAVVMSVRDDDQIQTIAPTSIAPAVATTAPTTRFTTPTTVAPSTTATTTTSPVTFADAIATPALAAPLQLLTITPSEPVTYCMVSQITVAVAEEGHLRQVGLINTDGSYVEDATPAIECEGSPPLDAPYSFRVPLSLGAGDFVVCLSNLDEPAGCAPVAIRVWAESCFEAPIAPPGLLDGSAPGEPSSSTDGTTVTWGTGRNAIDQVVGARPDGAWATAPFQVAHTGTYEVLWSSEPEAGVLSIIGGPDFCPRQYRVSTEYQLFHLRELIGGWLAFFADGTPVPTDGHPELPAPAEYYGVRTYSIGTDPVRAVHRFSPDGADLGEVDDSELIPNAPGVVLDDGRRIRFDPTTEQGDWCQTRPLLLGDASGERPLHPDLADASSFASTPGGRVVATRNICPGGTWGTAGTMTQTVLLDLTSPDIGVRVLFEDVVEPDEMGGLSVGWISPDGRFLVLSEPRTGESSRLTIVAVDDPTVPIQLPSGCDGATDIVSQPVLVADTVFIARACPSGDQTYVTVDQLTLPDLSLTWSVTVERELLAYCYCVGVSAGAGPVPSLILTGSSSVEVPNSSILVVGDEQTDITHLGFDNLAFTIAELLPS